jgi:hypothetical protein
MLDFVLIYQMFDDTKKGNQKPKIESKETMQQSNEKGRKDTLRRKLNAAYYEPIKT